MSKKGTWDDHGWVKCTLGDSKGRVLASSDDLQHNPFYSMKEQKVANFMSSMPSAASLTTSTEGEAKSDEVAVATQAKLSVASSVSSALQAVAKMLTPRSRSKEDQQNLKPGEQDLNSGDLRPVAA